MSQIHAIAMPKWGMEMSEGEIGAWHVAEGAVVAAGDELVDVETSKIVNTVTAHTGGVLRRIVAQCGQTLPVGALLGVLADAQTADAEIERFVSSLASAATDPAAPAPAPAAPLRSAGSAIAAAAPASAAAPVAAPAPVPPPAPPGANALSQGEDDSAVPATPIARRLAQRYGVNLHNVPASGSHGRVSKFDLERVVQAAGMALAPPGGVARGAGKPAPSRDETEVHATPVARRLAQQLGVSLHDCRSSGGRGRVCKADVEAAAALARRPAQTPGIAVPVPAAPPAFEESALGGMRRTIAARLQQSKQTAPHFRVHVDAEIDALLAVRRQINERNPDAKVSVNDFIVKACACALVRVPEINVQFDGTTLKHFRDADIAVAVALKDGLITPIVRAANRKGLITISNELRDLATRAKIGNLKPEEFQGGTFSVSNLGMFGVRQFDAIINPPQGAILAIGAAEQRPVVRNGSLAVATVVSLSLSSDHRIVDGAIAARFMGSLREYREQPATMLG